MRGSSGYGKTYLKLDNGTLREDAVKDIGALLDWIAAQPDLDAGRVGVIGGSYGGFMSLAVAGDIQRPDQGGHRHRRHLQLRHVPEEHRRSYRRDLRRAEYGDERDPEMRAFLERISPLANAARSSTPLLVVQGKNDPRVPGHRVRADGRRVRKNGGPVWYVVGKNEGHGFAKKANQDYLQAVEVLFWRRYLLGEDSSH